MRSHIASAENSERLKSVLDVLKDGLEHSTYEILHQAQVCAVNSIIHELRRNGYDIPRAVRRADRFYYHLERTGTVPSEANAVSGDGTVPVFNLGTPISRLASEVAAS